MGILKAALTMLLALLVAGPACCCHLPALLGFQNEAATPSCCAAASPTTPSPEQPSDSPCEEGQCHCADNPAEVTNPVLALPAPLSDELLPPLPRWELLLDAYPHSEHLLPDIAYQRPPSLTETSILFQVFRI